MKKIISVILMLSVILTMQFNVFADAGDVATGVKQIELWAVSPGITGGMTREEMNFQHALQTGNIWMYPLPKLGDGYIFARTETLYRNSGNRGRDDLYVPDYYLLLATDDSYIILDHLQLMSDYVSTNQIIYDISNDTKVPEKGDRALYAISMYGMYCYTNWSSWDECVFVTENKKFAHQYDYNGRYNERYMCSYIYNGSVYWGMPPSTDSGSSTDVALRQLYFENGVVTQGGYIYVTNAQINAGTEIRQCGCSYNFMEKSDIKTKPYYKMPGQTDLYFTIELEKHSTDSYYDLVVDMYRPERGIMKITKSNRLNTKSTISSLYSSEIRMLDNIDAEFYTSKGYSPPRVMISNKYLITESGQVATINLDTNIYYSTSYYHYAMYKHRLITVRYRDYTSYIYITDESGNNVYAQKYCYLFVNNNNEVEFGEDVTVPLLNSNNLDPDFDGTYDSYVNYHDCAAIREMPVTKASDYFNRIKSNVFPDGRKVEVRWVSAGSDREIYYFIYDADGIQIGYGPTGYMSDSYDEGDPMAIAESNTKFVFSGETVKFNKIREFYLVSKINNQDNNEVAMFGTGMGNKNIDLKIESDTVPVEAVIDFSKDELPIGFNIRDNVVDSDNLDAELREQINTIRLSDIVIIKSDDLETGVQNTGTTLDKFNVSDDSFGKCSILFYSNGQNFGWSCQTPSKLNAGTYNKYYKIGDKTVYVTIKIVEAPKNSGNVVVTF